MKAWSLNEINSFSFVENKEEPKVCDGKVLVKVRACGICGSDIPRVYTKGAHKMPITIGHEFSGVVVSTAKKDEQWLGKRVGVFPLIPCKKCNPCLDRQYEMCKSYSYIGSREDGAFSEYVLVDTWNLIELPSSVSFDEAAMLEPMAVSVHAIKRAESLLRKETKNTDNRTSTVVVCGLGTIGQLIIMFLLERGYKNILAIGNKSYNLECIEKLGLESSNYCDSSKDSISEWIQKKTNNLGADIFFECVGKNETVSAAVESMAANGCICYVGNPYSDMHFSMNTYWKILRNQIKITGTWNSTFYGSDSKEKDDWRYVLDRLENKRIFPKKLITHRFSIENIAAGFEIMKNKSENYIKIMMEED